MLKSPVLNPLKEQNNLTPIVKYFPFIQDNAAKWNKIFFQLQQKAAISYHLYRQFNKFWIKIFHKAIKKLKRDFYKQRNVHPAKYF